jgi:hypothetical protein
VPFLHPRGGWCNHGIGGVDDMSTGAVILALENLKYLYLAKQQDFIMNPFLKE